ncbi:winged helix-turn-helix transcriptional regulator [Pedobacter sp. KBS0701]|uniref:winged helix-turn-helix transcriptional regulator n=1 Tax=unclassified Pedobacter TaxID=2628915 RepID=UPI00110E9825|nr:helix-turn-helix domain-containing protein [Pedobacter sp. KBS0701]QDW27891.1 helix-turn-helix transcriptional regulator [Pedobacter sp. KBS0701]
MKEISIRCENDRNNCPVKDVLNRVGDKWSMLTVIMLSDLGMLRFNELHQLIVGISQKMLTVTLKMPGADGLLTRKMYAQIPPKVEYALAWLGENLVTPLMHLYDWANANMPEIKASRERYEKAVTL